MADNDDKNKSQKNILKLFFTDIFILFIFPLVVYIMIWFWSLLFNYFLNGLLEMDFPRIIRLLFFPILTVSSILTFVMYSIKEKRNVFYSLFLIFLSIILMWFISGKEVWEARKPLCEESLLEEMGRGVSFRDIGDYSNANMYFSNAIFIDKYIVTWNKNESIPFLYSEMAQGYSNLKEYDEADRYFEKTLIAFDKYVPDEKYEIAVVKLKASIVKNTLNNTEDAIPLTKEAWLYLSENEDLCDPYIVAFSYILLANEYYIISDYKEATTFFDQGIPKFYDSVSWGYGDEYYAKLLAIAYYKASISYEKIDELEKAKEYEILYNDFMWFRDFNEDDLSEVRKSLNL